MAKILIFVPHLDMMERFKKIIDVMPASEDIEFDMTYLFGTNHSLPTNLDADIMVARGMTYDHLHKIYPQKHIIEIKFSSFDILDALLQSKDTFHAKSIALGMHNSELNSLDNLERLCEAKIEIFDVYNEESAELAVDAAIEKGIDVCVGAGTMCVICDRKGMNRVHIQTKEEALREALWQAYYAAKTINLERMRTYVIELILNNNQDAIVAVDKYGKILELNNQMYQVYQLATQMDYKGQFISTVYSDIPWKDIILGEEKNDGIFNIQGHKYYIQCQSVSGIDRKLEVYLIFTKSTETIMEEEMKIRRGLSEKGLVAKYTFNDIIGDSFAMQNAIRVSEKYSHVNSNVLITGETGTGKELFAHSIHNASSRSNQPFVALNCAALPENLLESELFGYEPGSFSGASKNGKKGLFELAHKGTIFLDEIGEIPVSLQAKLLRVLQEKEIRRIGSTTVQPIDVRVISATNINIEKKIEESKFREDLYYRLNLLDITIPPLRERGKDILKLADYYFVKFACEMGTAVPTITPGVSKMLEEYSWPGNVRELRNVCEKLIVLCEGNVIDEELMQQRILKKTDFIKETSLENDPNRENNGKSREVIIHTKKKKKEIAEEMGVSRTTLWRMMKNQHGTDYKNG